MITISNIEEKELADPAKKTVTSSDKRENSRIRQVTVDTNTSKASKSDPVSMDFDYSRSHRTEDVDTRRCNEYGRGKDRYRAQDVSYGYKNESEETSDLSKKSSEKSGSYGLKDTIGLRRFYFNEGNDVEDAYLSDRTAGSMRQVSNDRTAGSTPQTSRVGQSGSASQTSLDRQAGSSPQSSIGGRYGSPGRSSNNGTGGSTVRTSNNGTDRRIPGSEGNAAAGSIGGNRTGKAASSSFDRSSSSAARSGKSSSAQSARTSGSNAGKTTSAKAAAKTASSQADKSSSPKTGKTSTSKAKKASDSNSGKASSPISDGSSSTYSSSGAKTKKKAKSKGNKGSGSGGGKPRRKKRHPVVIFLRAFILTLLIIFITGGIAGTAYTAYVISHAATIHPDRIYETLDVSTHIYDDNEKLVDDIYFSENRDIIKYEQLPDNLKNAFIAIEDKTFWTHKGFNFRRIVGAILERFHGGRISGTSTITQQLARNIFLPEEKSNRSLKRKITEMYYSYVIEEELSKEEILTAYLNTIYLGYGCYGVDTAAKSYFSKSVNKLTLAQCAALAAIPQAPTDYALLVTQKGEHTTKLKKKLYANDTSEDRRNLVLQLMEEQGYITAKQHKKATKPLADFIKPGSEGIASKSAFKDYLIETVRADLMEEYDLTEEQASKMIYTKGLRIYSTMDRQAQQTITSKFKDTDSFPHALSDGSAVEAAMVITEVGTGQVKAMVGTRNSTGQMLFNRATNPRQPGSSIKPLAVYAAALQKSYEYQQMGSTFPFQDFGFDKQGDKKWGKYLTAGSTVIDEKMTINGSEWPHNVTRSYSGKNTFRTAIQKSINTCAVKILAQVGISYSIEMLHKFGITTLIDDYEESRNDLNYSALGLGAMTEGVTPLDMAAAYAAFPNGGEVNSPICYTKVEDSNGRTILEKKSAVTRVMDEGVAWIMTDVLKSIVTDGIGYNAHIDGISVGGKTGTTDNRYDIWFDGFTPTYSAALWIGTDDNVVMDSASDVAATLWSSIMSNVDRAYGGEYRSAPSNVIYKDGEYYTYGTEPPDKKVSKKSKKKKSGDDEDGDYADFGDDDQDNEGDDDGTDIWDDDDSDPYPIDDEGGWSDGESDIFEP